MASTYSPGASTRDRVRLWLGDTGADGGVFLLSDEEIDAELSGSTLADAVARLAEGLDIRFGQYPDETTTPGGHKMKWSQRCEAWRNLASGLRTGRIKLSRGTMAKLGNLTNPTENRLR